MAAHLPLKGKVIAITGAASGIGLATAHLLASRGATLSLADMSSEALAEHSSDIRTKHSVQVHEFVLDVRKTSLVDAWIKDIITQFGKLDGTANMAGVAPKSIGVKGVAEQDEDEWEFVLGINLTGTMHCLRAQLGVISQGGSIVNAASELRLYPLYQETLLIINLRYRWSDRKNKQRCI
jgi:NAD(P)-dependent dehydrogenase (short-subunit alcohol dehydrogenase family)